jgi:hypothetical protein
MDQVRRSLLLWPDEWEALAQLAQQFKTLAPTGPNAGQASWRSLVKEIARGNLVVAPRETLEKPQLGQRDRQQADWRQW